MQHMRHIACNIPASCVELNWADKDSAKVSAATLVQLTDVCRHIHCQDLSTSTSCCKLVRMPRMPNVIQQVSLLTSCLCRALAQTGYVRVVTVQLKCLESHMLQVRTCVRQIKENSMATMAHAVATYRPATCQLCSWALG